jgi:hypothetical protein
MAMKGRVIRNEVLEKLMPDSISTEATSGLIIAMVNSLLRRKKLKLDGIQGLKEITVEFFRRSLVKN